MKTLQIIELRTSMDKTKSVRKYLSLWVNQVKQSLKAGSKVISFRHLHLSNDFSIHLLTENKEEVAALSLLGKQLVSSLKTYGLVSYSAWEEQTDEKICK